MYLKLKLRNKCMDENIKHKIICDIISKLEEDYKHDFHGIRSEVYRDLHKIISENIK